MDYLITFFSIFIINILLSGDNALVIALASRSLPEQQKRKAVIYGSVGAVVFRIVLSLVAVYLLAIPYLQLVAGVLLFWIAVKLIRHDQTEIQKVEAKSSLGGAIKTIIIADIVMSLDNVVAIAGAAKGNLTLIIIGLAVSIPLIIWGSNLISMLMQRWPIIIILGAALLGWTAGDMILEDKKVLFLIANSDRILHYIFPAGCAILAVVIGELVARSGKSEKDGSS